jgi:hypothetical protein
MTMTHTPVLDKSESCHTFTAVFDPLLSVASLLNRGIQGQAALMVIMDYVLSYTFIHALVSCQVSGPGDPLIMNGVI